MNIFVTGTGTDVGKTVVAAILTEALRADYWKPVQAGSLWNTDSHWVRSVLSNEQSIVHEEAFRLTMPASPHIAAKEDGVAITMQQIKSKMPKADNLVIEGAGGIMVPLNENDFVADLVADLEARVVIVSQNVLGSINHSLLTAMACRQKKLRVLGWIFNGNYLNYEDQIAEWSGFPKLASIPFTSSPDKKFISAQAAIIERSFYNWPW